MYLDSCVTQKSWHKSSSFLARKFYTDGFGKRSDHDIAQVVGTACP